MEFDLKKHTIYYGRHGSHAYGTNTPSSDEDFKGVAVAPMDYYLGCFKNFEQAERYVSKGHEKDEVIYDIRKFIQLAANANPNILEVLFIDESDILVLSDLGRKLRDHSNLFVTKKIRHTMAGYAHSQAQRIKTHRAWLLNPPKEKPEREHFGLSKVNKISASEMGAYEHVINQGETLPDSIMAILNQEKKYAAAKRNWDQYQNWKETRNKDRSELEAKFGYDCYHKDTEFLTDHGWLRYDDITSEMKLGTINPKTQKLEFQYFFDRVKKPFKGNLLKFETQDTKCLVTPNHRMFASLLGRSKKNNWSTEYSPIQANWKIERAETVVSGEKSFYHILTAPNPMSDSDGNYIHYEDNPEISDDLLIIVGSYVSEGCVAKRNKEGPSVLVISQLEGGRQEVYLEMVDRYRKYPYYRLDKEKIENKYYLSNLEEVQRIVEWCGEYSDQKKLPDWIISLSPRQAKLLLDVLIAGDGTQRKHSQTYYTVSSRLANDVMTLALICGFTTKLWGPYQYKNKKPVYQVYISRDKENVETLRTNAHIEEEVCETEIVCFSVPNEMLITRLDGKVAIQGNTKHAYHLVRLMRMAREVLEGKGVIVKRVLDRDELLGIRKGAWSYDQLIEWFKKQDAELNDLYNASTLPFGPDQKKLDQLCMDIILEFHGVQRWKLDW